MEIFELLKAEPVALFITVGVISILVGSFINALAHRLPLQLEHTWRSQCRELLELEQEELAAPPKIFIARSACPKCDHMLSWWENIPVLSYLFLRGKCAHCKTPISFQYPLVELLTLIFSLIVVWRFGYGWALCAGLLFTWVLMTLSVIDFKTMLLPDALTLTLMWMGIIANMYGVFISLEDSVLGAVLGYMVLWLFFHLYQLLTGKEGMGFGDFKIVAAMGAWAGWQVLAFVIFAASIFGLLYYIVLFIITRKSEAQVPFGPWLACSGYIAFVWRDEVINGMVSYFKL